MSSLTLYDAADELRTLFDTLDGLEDPAEVAEFQQEMERAFARALQKVESFAGYLAHLDSQAELCAAEIQRITARKKQFAERAAKLREYAIHCMQAHGVSKLESPTVALRLQQNPPAVVIENEDFIPQEFREVSIKMTQPEWNELVRAAEKLGEDQYSVQVAALISDIADANCLADRNSRVSVSEIGRKLKAGEEVPGAHLRRAVRLVVK